MRPTVHLGVTDPGGTWTSRDRCLTEALLFHEDSLNDQGVPAWIAQDPDREWTIDEIVDHPAAALEEAREEYQRGEGKNHGLHLIVVEKARPQELSAPGDDG